MDLEHIDGNYSNNDISNLCLLCPNCHSQTNTFKGRNKGNGRHLRKPGNSTEQKDVADTIGEQAG